MEEMFIEKPVGKPVKNFRARVKMYGNDVVVVNPMEPRESNRRMIKQKGKSSFYKSEGEKDKLLYDSEYLQVYLNKTQKNVVFKTTLPCSPTIERELLRLQSEMGKVIDANYSEIIKVFNTVKKDEKKADSPSDKEIIDRV